jgi:hypothetical protein
MKPAIASVCRTGPPAYVAWRASTTTRHRSRLHPPIQGLRKRLQNYWLFLFKKIFSTFQAGEEIRIHDRRQAVLWCRTPLLLNVRKKGGLKGRDQ